MKLRIKIINNRPQYTLYTIGGQWGFEGFVLLMSNVKVAILELL